MTVRAIAFHLPQFHRIEKDDEWWGEGIAEWTNMVKAKPLFKDH
jgi:Glycosyltransferase WbsX